MKILRTLLIILNCSFTLLKAQVYSFPYNEPFDGAAPPVFPAGWSADGFSVSASVPRSLPNCIVATGNMTEKSVFTPSFDFTGRFPGILSFWERRSATASAYRLELNASTDGIDYDIHLQQFDSSGSTSSYTRRSVNLAGSGLEQQPSVRFRWRLIGDAANNTGVLRIDDVSLSLAAIDSDKVKLIINEIMFDPFQEQNEWIELFNPNNVPVNLQYWSFHDRPTQGGSNLFEISSSGMTICPGGFAVVAAESSLFSLYNNPGFIDSNVCVSILNRTGGFSFNNDGDAVVLKDPASRTIDSAAYLCSWHRYDLQETRGRSLERISPNIDSNDPRNWSTCSDYSGGTPGRINSNYISPAAVNNIVSATPNPFSPDGDGFEDFCMIRCEMKTTAAILNIRIYDIKGRLIRVLANNEPVGPQGEIIWDGLDDNKQRARAGVYILFLEAKDLSTNSTVTGKKAIVVATRL